MTVPQVASGSLSTPVLVRDRRELPFFQIRLRAIQAIRAQVSGPRRLRTIGLYGLLCQLANEQRHIGEHRRVQFSYSTLAKRGGVGNSQLKGMLDALGGCEAIRCEQVIDPAHGSIVSVAHLLILDEPWTAITVAMADALAARRRGGHLLRDLGLVTVLLEFCVAQRETAGGLTAEVSRNQLAERAGLTVDRLDDCHRILKDAGVLTITRRRPANGGRNLPSHYTIHEAPDAQTQGGETDATGRRNGSYRAAEQEPQGGILGITDRQDGNRRAAEQERQGGDSAHPSPRTPLINARASWAVEEQQIEKTPFGAGRSQQGGREDLRQEICRRFVETWEPVLGDSPLRAWRARPGEWTAAADRLLERHSPQRIEVAMDGMLADEILSGRALTMPDFEKVADQLIVRHHARGRRATTTVTGESNGKLSWTDAKRQLERAIQRYGRDQPREAIAALAAEDPQLATFVSRVRWSQLCEAPMKFTERRYADLWNELSGSPSAREEPAA